MSKSDVNGILRSYNSEKLKVFEEAREQIRLIEERQKSLADIVNGAPFIAKLTVEEYHLTNKTRAYNLQKIEMSDLSRAQFSQMIEENRGKYAYKSDALSIAQLYEFVKTKDSDKGVKRLVRSC